MMTIEQLVNDSDWIAAFDEATKLPPRPVLEYKGSTDPFVIADVAEVIASSDGENDGPDWIGVFLLKDGRFVMVRAGCDYTGWDCQAGGDAEVADTITDLVRWGMKDEERTRLNADLTDHWNAAHAETRGLQ